MLLSILQYILRLYVCSNILCHKSISRMDLCPQYDTCVGAEYVWSHCRYHASYVSGSKALCKLIWNHQSEFSMHNMKDHLISSDDLICTNGKDTARLHGSFSCIEYSDLQNLHFYFPDCFHYPIICTFMV